MTNCHGFRTARLMENYFEFSLPKKTGDATFAALTLAAQTFAAPSQSDTCGDDTCGADICGVTLAPPTLATPTLAAPTLAAPTLAAPTLAAPTNAAPTDLPRFAARFANSVNNLNGLRLFCSCFCHALPACNLSAGSTRGEGVTSKNEKC
ncbi:hypothetical protein niasHT_011635 [Heterodera trifolii]|uniref:Uncharacterized protein n=1 Tax=Heterodera trifolii TaxID=157864 RepID=A0ABD2LHB6_9BILA